MTQEFIARFLKLVIDWIKKHNCKVSNKIRMISQILNDIFSYSNTKKEPHFHFKVMPYLSKECSTSSKPVLTF